MLFKVPPASMLTVGKIARMLHIHENTVRRWSNQGILKAYRFGMRGERRFVKADVEALIVMLNKNNSDERISPCSRFPKWKTKMANVPAHRRNHIPMFIQW